MDYTILKPKFKKSDKVTLAQNGDKEAFSDLINEHKLELYKLGKSILSDDNDIADAMQETIYSCYKNLCHLKNSSGFKPWLLKIMINKCNDILRKKQKVIPVESIEEQETSDSYPIHNKYIYDAIKDLDDDLKLLVMLYYCEDMSISDISSQMKIPKGTIKSRLSRARKKLYESLKEDNCYGR